MTTLLPPGPIDPLVSDDGLNDDDYEIGSPHPRFVERQVAVQNEILKHRSNKVVALCIVVALAVLGWAITQSPLLDVDEIQVDGAVTVDPAAVATLSQIEPGDALLGLDLELAEDRLEIVPTVAGATVAKSWNGLVTIAIEERVPTLQFDNGSVWLLTGADGIVIAHEDEPRAGVPGVRGALFETAPGRRVPTEVTVSLTVASAMPSDIAAVVETVTQTADSILLDLYGGATIELGDARNLNEKFAAARAFIAHVELRCVEAINVQAPTVPVLTRSTSC